MRLALDLARARLARRPAVALLTALAVALIAGTPLAVRAIGARAADALLERARATPLVLGAQGGEADIALAALAFTPPPRPMAMRAVTRIAGSGLAEVHPLHLGFSARGAPLVGAHFDYFGFRGLVAAAGRLPVLPGEAVLGARAARRLGLGPGDPLPVAASSPFDLAGPRPVTLGVVGVLAPTGGPDDEAAFADLATVWVIEGIGHAHGEGEPVPHGFADAPPGALHFHGDPGGYPVSVAIVVPRDGRAAAILAGRHLAPEATERLVSPLAVAERLIEGVLRLRPALDAAALGAAAGGAVLLGLVWALGLKLRAAEFRYFDEVGCPRRVVAASLGLEAAAILVGGLALAALAAAGLAAAGLTLPVAGTPAGTGFLPPG